MQIQLLSILNRALKKGNIQSNYNIPYIESGNMWSVMGHNFIDFCEIRIKFKLVSIVKIEMDKSSDLIIKI